MKMYCKFCCKDIDLIEGFVVDEKGQRYPVYIHEVTDFIFGNGHGFIEDKALFDLTEKEK